MAAVTTALVPSAAALRERGYTSSVVQHRAAAVVKSRVDSISKAPICARTERLRSSIFATLHALRPASLNGQQPLGPWQLNRVQASAADVSTLPQTWPAFADIITGAWDGYATDMEPSGKPIELPREALPEAFREWGISVFAWQTHADADVTSEGRLLATCVRFMPAVGCEVTNPTVFCVEQTDAGVGSPSAGVLGFRADGCYSFVSPGRARLAESSQSGYTAKVVVREGGSDGGGSGFTLEHCLVADNNLLGADSSDRARVRVQQQFEGGLGCLREGKLPRLTGITLFREKWGAHLEAEERVSSEFADGPDVTVDAVEGRWLATNYTARISQANPLAAGGSVVELQPSGSEEITRELTEEGAVLLPQGVWSRTFVNSQGTAILKAGWLVEKDRALVSRFDFSKDGVLESIQISSEKRISAQV